MKLVDRRGDSVNRLEYEGEPTTRPYERCKNIIMEISYFPQTEAKLNGASALKMVLDTLGYGRDISTIWNAVANSDGTGCRTVALARYALYLGASSVIIRTQKPKINLFNNLKNNIYTLVNIRLDAESGYGRFAIVDYVDPANLVYSHTDSPYFEDIYYFV